jgi:hypothetical protein
LLVVFVGEKLQQWQVTGIPAKTNCVRVREACIVMSRIRD